jgi:acyl carrier protein
MHAVQDISGELMDNNAKLIKIFCNSLGVDEAKVTGNLEYNSIAEWDSVAHMTLIANLEQAFDIMLDTDDIIDMNSVEKAREILARYDVEF